MSLHSAINTISGINAILGSTTGFINDRQAGINTSDALFNLSGNLMMGAVRNSMADSIYHNSGSYLGYAVNNAAGYGDYQSNFQAARGLMGAALITDPWMTSSLYGCGPYGSWGGHFGSYWGGGMFGGCGIGSMFSPFGFYC